MEVISRKDMLEALEKQGYSPSVMRRLIIQMPSVDAVEVVRCRDCIMKDPPGEFGDLTCHILGVPMKDDDFCSYGERRENHDV